ncbi:MAG: hypothetical protein ACPGYP_09650 [Solirubrobacterales bacterium]
MERVMPFVETPIVIYTDANTDVNPEAINYIVRHYQDPNVGAVAGEKRIRQHQTDHQDRARCPRHPHRLACGHHDRDPSSPAKHHHLRRP